MVFSVRNTSKDLVKQRENEGNMKTVAIIAARMDSSGLPGKVMMPILGKPMIQHMIERIRYSKYIDEIVIATTKLPNDDVLASLSEKLHISCFRGAIDDVWEGSMLLLVQ